MNWNDFYGGLKEGATKAWDDVVATGVPALQSSAEKWAIEVLTKQNEATQAKLEENVSEIMQRPTEPGSFGEAMQSAVSSPILKEYGMQIVLGVAGVLLLGMFLRK